MKKDWRKEKKQKEKKAVRAVAKIWAKQEGRPYKEIMEEMNYRPGDVEQMNDILRIANIAKKTRIFDELKALKVELKWCKENYKYAANKEQFSGYINGIRKAIKIVSDINLTASSKEI